jgi:bifunctional DNA-binding transcriptional regulator/antitoxin component of YhaV-PrlF toxin-antitoxin module
MYAVEFKATIKDGTITIPEKFRENINKNVKVILLSEEREETSYSIIEDLLKSPLNIPNFKPYTREEIYDRT